MNNVHEKQASFPSNDESQTGPSAVQAMVAITKVRMLWEQMQRELSTAERAIEALGIDLERWNEEDPS